MAYWLVKSEPDAFSWDQQVQNGTEPWTGVRNHSAKLNLKAMKKGDLAFFYHSNIGKEIVGIVEVAREAYPDPTASTGDWVCVDMRAVQPVPAPVTLATIKADPQFHDLALIRLSRLSVSPVSPEHWQALCKLGKVNPKKRSQDMTTETAVLAGGCFWCLEAAYQELAGVAHVQSGYTGGHVDNPSYQQVCTGTTGHAEAVVINFDPSLISYADILRVFYTIHDPTTLNRQGADVGTQYRSAIYTIGEVQMETAHAITNEFQKLWPNRIVTEITPLGPFFRAEPEHDNYFARNPYAGYCQAVVAPKVVKVRKEFAEKLRSRAA